MLVASFVRARPRCDVSGEAACDRESGAPVCTATARHRHMLCGKWLCCGSLTCETRMYAGPHAHVPLPAPPPSPFPSPRAFLHHRSNRWHPPQSPAHVSFHVCGCVRPFSQSPPATCQAGVKRRRLSGSGHPPSELRRRPHPGEMLAVKWCCPADSAER